MQCVQKNAFLSLANQQRKYSNVTQPFFPSTPQTSSEPIKYNIIQGPLAEHENHINTIKRKKNHRTIDGFIISNTETCHQ